MTDPYKLFNTLFAGASMPVTQVNALLAKRKSVLDHVGKQLTGFSTRLGAEDKAKVQIHLDSIRALEMQLQAMPATTTTTCTAPSITPTGLSFSNSNNTNYPMQVQFMADLVAAAVICGKARAVTMDLIDNGGGNSLTFPWLSISSPDFHAIAHKGSADYVQQGQDRPVVLAGVRGQGREQAGGRHRGRAARSSTTPSSSSATT